MATGSTTEQACACGTTFVFDAPFCRSCGLKRPADAGFGSATKETLPAELQREFPFQAYIENAAQRTITLRQFRQVIDYMKRSCSRWVNSGSSVPTMESIDWHQVNEWMIQPATQDKRSAFVELLTSRGQDPTVFVSHCWGEKVVDFVRCVMVHAETRVLSEDSGFWVCAFARRQHSRDSTVVSFDEQKNETAMALQLSKNLLLILDDRTDTGQGTVFSRIWCLYEVFVALGGADGSQPCTLPLLDIATVRRRKAELLTDGIAAADCRPLAPAGPSSAEAARIDAAQAKARREATFPIEVLRSGLKLEVKKAVASVEGDLAAILNSLAGRDAGEQPVLEAHEGYLSADRRLQAAVAVAMLPQAMLKQKTEEMQLADIISADDRLQSLDLSFVSSGITDMHASSIARALPASLRLLRLDFAQTAIGDSGISALMSALPAQLTRLTMGFSFTKVGDAGLGVLGCMLPKKLKRLELRLAGLDISDAGVAKLVQALPGELEELGLCFSECAGLGDAAVMSIAKEALASLKVLQLDLSKCKGRGLSAHSLTELSSGLAQATALIGLKLLLGDCAAVTDACANFTTCLSEQLKDLELDLACTSLSDAALGQLAVPLGKLARLEKLSLNFRGCGLSDSGARAFIREAPVGLKAVNLNFGETRISDVTVEELGKLPRSLQTLSLGFAGCTGISEDGFAKLAEGLPNRFVDATFCFTGCLQFGDFAMASLVLSLPEQLSMIEFQGMPQTSVTPENAYKFKGVDRIQEWRKELQSTKEYLRSGRLPPSLNDVLRLDFQAFSKKFGEKEMVSLAKLMPASLSELHLNFNSCGGITDDALAKLGSSLPQEKLSQLVLSFSGCSKISDVGIGKLAEGLPACMQTFKLNLRNCKGITDAGTMSIQQNLPIGLPTLRLSLDGTRVSEQRRRSLERFEKPQSPVKEDAKRKPQKKEKQQKKKDEDAQRARQQAEEDMRLQVAEESRRRVTELQSWITQDLKRKQEEDRQKQEQLMKEEARRLEEEQRKREELERKQAEEARSRREEEERQKLQEEGKAKEETFKQRKVTRFKSFDINLMSAASKRAEEQTDTRATRHSATAGSPKRPSRQRPKSAAAKASWSKAKTFIAPNLDDMELSLADDTVETTTCLGSYVEVDYCGSTVQGIVRFMGEVNFAPGEWLGVALEQPLSNHDGSMLGKRYFQARPGCGLFVLPSAVKTAKAPGVFSVPKLIPVVDAARNHAIYLDSEQSPRRSPSSVSISARSMSSPCLSGRRSRATSTASSSPFGGLSPKSARRSTAASPFAAVSPKSAQRSSGGQKLGKALGDPKASPPWENSSWVKERSKVAGPANLRISAN